MYIEASTPAQDGDIAELNCSPPVGGASCVSFYYHSWGSDTGFLSVQERGPFGSRELLRFINVNGEMYFCFMCFTKLVK